MAQFDVAPIQQPENPLQAVVNPQLIAAQQLRDYKMKVLEGLMMNQYRQEHLNLLGQWYGGRIQNQQEANQIRQQLGLGTLENRVNTLEEASRHHGATEEIGRNRLMEQAGYMPTFGTPSTPNLEGAYQDKNMPVFGTQPSLTPMAQARLTSAEGMKNRGEAMKTSADTRASLAPSQIAHYKAMDDLLRKRGYEIDTMTPDKLAELRARTENELAGASLKGTQQSYVGAPIEKTTSLDTAKGIRTEKTQKIPLSNTLPKAQTFSPQTLDDIRSLSPDEQQQFNRLKTKFPQSRWGELYSHITAGRNQ